jgi:hypothetical protein
LRQARREAQKKALSDILALLNTDRQGGTFFATSELSVLSDTMAKDPDQMIITSSSTIGTTGLGSSSR